MLTDKSVTFAAQAALRNTPGDLGQRVMAGMEAARALGGDGDCNGQVGCARQPSRMVGSAGSQRAPGQREATFAAPSLALAGASAPAARQLLQRTLSNAPSPKTLPSTSRSR